MSKDDKAQAKAQQKLVAGLKKLEQKMLDELAKLEAAPHVTQGWLSTARFHVKAAVRSGVRAISPPAIPAKPKPVDLLDD